MDKGQYVFAKPVRKYINRPEIKEQIIDTSYNNNKKVFEELNNKDNWQYALLYVKGAAFVAACIVVWYLAKWIMN